MSKKERRAAYAAESAKLFELIDSFELGNIYDAQDMIYNNPALRHRAQNRYYGLMRCICPDLGASWALLEEVEFHAQIPVNLYNFYLHYKTLGDITPIRRLANRTSLHNFMNLPGLEEWYYYLSLGEIITPVATGICIWNTLPEDSAEFEKYLHIPQPELLQNIEVIRLDYSPRLAAALLQHLAAMPKLRILSLHHCAGVDLSGLVEAKSLKYLQLVGMDLPAELLELPKFIEVYVKNIR